MPLNTLATINTSLPSDSEDSFITYFNEQQVGENEPDNVDTQAVRTIFKSFLIKNPTIFKENTSLATALLSRTRAPGLVSDMILHTEPGEKATFWQISRATQALFPFSHTLLSNHQASPSRWIYLLKQLTENLAALHPGQGNDFQAWYHCLLAIHRVLNMIGMLGIGKPDEDIIKGINERLKNAEKRITSTFKSHLMKSLLLHLAQDNVMRAKALGKTFKPIEKWQVVKHTAYGFSYATLSVLSVTGGTLSLALAIASLAAYGAGLAILGPALIAFGTGVFMAIVFAIESIDHFKEALGPFKPRAEEWINSIKKNVLKGRGWSSFNELVEALSHHEALSTSAEHIDWDPILALFDEDKTKKLIGEMKGESLRSVAYFLFECIKLAGKETLKAQAVQEKLWGKITEMSANLFSKKGKKVRRPKTLEFILLNLEQLKAADKITDDQYDEFKSQYDSIIPANITSPENFDTRLQGYHNLSEELSKEIAFTVQGPADKNKKSDANNDNIGSTQLSDHWFSHFSLDEEIKCLATKYNSVLKNDDKLEDEAVLKTITRLKEACKDIQDKRYAGTARVSQKAFTILRRLSSRISRASVMLADLENKKNQSIIDMQALRQEMAIADLKTSLADFYQYHRITQLDGSPLNLATDYVIGNISSDGKSKKTMAIDTWWDSFLMQKINNVLIGSTPGMGKSTLLSYFVFDFYAKVHPSSTIQWCLHIDLKYIFSNEQTAVIFNDKDWLVNLIYYGFFNKARPRDVLSGFSFDKAWCMDLIRKEIIGKPQEVILLLDGLDEVLYVEKSENSNLLLKTLLETFNNRIMVGEKESLPVLFQCLDEVEFSVFEINVFDRMQRVKFLDNYDFYANEKKQLKNLVADDTSFKKLAEVPTTLSMLCVVWKSLSPKEQEGLSGKINKSFIYKRLAINLTPKEQEGLSGKINKSFIYKRLAINLMQHSARKYNELSPYNIDEKKLLNSHEWQFLINIAVHDLKNTQMLEINSAVWEPCLKKYNAGEGSRLRKQPTSSALLVCANPTEQPSNRRYHFIHSSIKEFAAAWWFFNKLQKNPADKELAMMVAQTKYNPRFYPVWVCLGELLDANPHELFAFIKLFLNVNLYGYREEQRGKVFDRKTTSEYASKPPTKIYNSRAKNFFKWFFKKSMSYSISEIEYSELMEYLYAPLLSLLKEVNIPAYVACCKQLAEDKSHVVKENPAIVNILKKRYPWLANQDRLTLFCANKLDGIKFNKNDKEALSLYKMVSQLLENLRSINKIKVNDFSNKIENGSAYAPLYILLLAFEGELNTVFVITHIHNNNPSDEYIPFLALALKHLIAKDEAVEHEESFWLGLFKRYQTASNEYDTMKKIILLVLAFLNKLPIDALGQVEALNYPAIYDFYTLENLQALVYAYKARYASSIVNEYYADKELCSEATEIREKIMAYIKHLDIPFVLVEGGVIFLAERGLHINLEEVPTLHKTLYVSIQPVCDPLSTQVLRIINPLPMEKRPSSALQSLLDTLPALTETIVDVPQEKNNCEIFKKALEGLLKEGFNFQLLRKDEKTFTIGFNRKNSPALLKNIDISGKLIRLNNLLVNALLDRDLSVGLDKDYQLRLNRQTLELTIIAKDRQTGNAIGNLLEQAGGTYLQPAGNDAAKYSSIFQCPPKVQQKLETVPKHEEVVDANVSAIACPIQ